MSKKLSVILALVIAFSVVVPLGSTVFASTSVNTPVTARTFEEINQMFPNAGLANTSTSEVIEKIQNNQRIDATKTNVTPVKTFHKDFPNGDNFTLEIFEDDSYRLLGVEKFNTLVRSSILFKNVSAASGSYVVSAQTGSGVLNLWKVQFTVNYDNGYLFTSANSPAGTIGLLGATQNLQCSISSPTVLTTRSARAPFSVMYPVVYQNTIVGYTQDNYYLYGTSTSSGISSSYTGR
jgi:hypothetical protein